MNRGEVGERLVCCFLGRQADPGGQTTQLNAYNAGGVRAVIMNLLSSPEFFNNAGGTNQGFLSATYMALFHRAVDPQGLSNFLGQLNFGLPRPALVDQLLHSPEFAQVEINEAYQRYLGRPADPAGLQMWIPVYLNNPEEFLVAFLSTPEFSSRLSLV